MNQKNGKYLFIINRYIEITIPYYDNLLYLNKRKLLWTLKFSESPAVTVREIDLTGVVPSVTSTTGGFRW